MKNAQLFNFKDFEEEGKQIVAQAQAQAKAILETAEAEKQAIHEKSQAEGKKEGLAQGFADGKEEGLKLGEKSGQEAVAQNVSQAIDALTSVSTEIESRIHELCNNAQNDFISLVKQTAEKVIRKHLESDSEVIKRTLDDIIEKVIQKNSLIIKINPEDKAAVQSWIEAWEKDVTAAKAITLLPNDSISRGGCIIDSPDGGVDATIETQIQTLIEAL